jgi:lipoprotein-releasing system permease protein
VASVEAVSLQRHTFGAIPINVRDSDGSRSNYLPVRIVGLVPADEAKVSNVIQSMQRGAVVREGSGAEPLPEDPFRIVSEDFIPESVPRVVISGWMARRMTVQVGDPFPLLTFQEVTRDGRPTYEAVDRDVIVSRIYSSGNSEFDKLHIYVNLKGTGTVFFDKTEGTINELRVKLHDYTQADQGRLDIARALEPYNPEIARWPHHYVETWEQRQRNLLRAVDNEKFILAIVMFFIVIVACFTIFATLYMTVAEKTRDIGVLLALGATRGGILSIFMINGTTVGLIGAAMGYGLGLLVANNVNPIRAFIKSVTGWDIFPSEIYLFDQIPTYIDHEAALYFALAAAGWALLFAIVPAVRAARLQPVRALRYE